MWKSKTSSEFSIEFQYLVDKYGSKHTGSLTNVQAIIGGMYGQMRTDGVYRRERKNGVYTKEGKEREVKDTRTLRLNDNAYHWYKLISSFLKDLSDEGTQNQTTIV